MNQLALDLQPPQTEYRIHLHKDLYAIVDFQDYEWLAAFNWSALYDRDTKSYRACRQIIVTGKPKTIIMAREIMGNPKGRIVDHRNHNTLDNRRENLRVCSNSESACNRRRFSNNTSGHKGVCWRKDTLKWRAYIHVNGKRVDLGQFQSKESAAAAYRAAAPEVHGEFYSL